MKRLLNISRSAAVILSVFAFLAACTPDITHYRGRDNWPDDNTPGRNGGHGGKDDGTYRLDYGYANYYGYFYPTSPATDNYLLYLYSGATDKNGKFTKNGVILTLDLLMYESSSLALANGVYSCSDDGEAFTFIPTYSSDDSEFDGSSLYIQTDLDNYRTYAVTGGSVHITRKVTGVYEIEADIKSEAGEYSFIFKGMVDIKDDRQGGDEPGGDEPGEKPSFPGPEGSEWAARALFQNHLDDNKTDEYTLFLSLGDYAANGIDFKTSGSEIAIELFTTKGAGNSIASGTYKCISENPEPFTFFDGYYWTDDDGNNVLDPSYFYRQYSAKDGDYSLEAVTDGNLTINKRMGDSDMYSIEFAYSTESNKSYKIRYEGQVKFEKADTRSQTKSAGLKAVRSSAAGRTLPPVKREVGANRVER